MKTKESVLSQAEKDDLLLSNFIFHIIAPDDENSVDGVIFLDDVILGTNQIKFFSERLKETAEGTQYIFKAESISLKDKCSRMLQDKSLFNSISRQITTDFSDRHKGNMSPGVFVTAIASIPTDQSTRRDLVFLVKLDHKASITYDYIEENGTRKAIVKEIPHALIESKSAVQKSALIDISDNVSWDILAFDKGSDNLRDYFRAFLGVTELQDHSHWTRVAFQTAKTWARGLFSEDMPEGESFIGYKGRAQRYLQDSTKFSTENYINCIIKDEDIERKTRLSNKLREALESSGIAGQVFTPKPNSIKEKEKKQVIKTKEGVQIIFEGDPESVGVQISPPDAEKKRTITITSKELTFKE